MPDPQQSCNPRLREAGPQPALPNPPANQLPFTGYHVPTCLSLPFTFHAQTNCTKREHLHNIAPS